MDRRSDGERAVVRMEVELERGDDAEVWPGAAHRPEQVRVLVASARTRRPSAVTSSTARRLSIVKPCLRCSRPMPPPSVRPPTPVCETTPTGQTSPCACAATSSSPSNAPPATRAVRVVGIYGRAAHPRKVDNQAAIARAQSRAGCGRHRARRWAGRRRGQSGSR